MRTLQRSLLTIAALSMFSSPVVLAQDQGEQGHSRTGTGSEATGNQTHRSQQRGTSESQRSTRGSAATDQKAQGGSAQGSTNAQQRTQGQTGSTAEQQSPQQSSGATHQGKTTGMMGSDTGMSLSIDQRKQLQERLRTDGYYHGEIDGVLGQTTKDALRKFQQANQIPATGEVNQKTMATLGMRVGGQQGQTSERSQGTSGAQKSARISEQETVKLSDLKQSQVEALQRKLKEYGVYKGEINGQANQETRKALTSFYQEQARMVSSGKLLSDSATALTGDTGIQRVRGEDDEKSDTKKSQKREDKTQQQRNQTQQGSQGQIKQPQGTQRSDQSGAQNQREQQSGDQSQRDGAGTQGGWRNRGTTDVTPPRQMPEGLPQNEGTLHTPHGMPNNPR